MPSRRLATFTVSPSVVNSSRSAMPTLPCTTVPKWIPMPTELAIMPRWARSAPQASIVSRITAAHSSAS
jgi:hypothetical protein